MYAHQGDPGQWPVPWYMYRLFKKPYSSSALPLHMLVETVVCEAALPGQPLAVQDFLPLPKPFSRFFCMAARLALISKPPGPMTCPWVPCGKPLFPMFPAEPTLRAACAVNQAWKFWHHHLGAGVTINLISRSTSSPGEIGPAPHTLEHKSCICTMSP